MAAFQPRLIQALRVLRDSRLHTILNALHAICDQKLIHGRLIGTLLIHGRLNI